MAHHPKPRSIRSVCLKSVSVGLCLMVLQGASVAWANEDMQGGAEMACGELLNHEHRLLASKKSLQLCEAFKGQVILVVNTASQCGFTGQFEGLEALYQTHKDKGFVVLGFPSNDFRQEHSDESDTADVCQINYGVTFPMFATSSVKGPNANHLFAKLNAATKAPSWNFNKYLIGRDGAVIEHFGSMTKPMGGRLEARLVEALNQAGPNS